MEQEIMILDEEDLFFQKDPNSWNIVHCLEHLNRYAAYYLPAIDTAISCAQISPTSKNTQFPTTWLGRLYVRSLHPENVKKSKR
ncbi:DinB family protein [Fulvivirgaceae bacterium BMA10]|uniref:DinB family protein n=1 Tax=Splendidivirga corallicola TaxID=3051826 RepID=A0ABT8KH39_9BACT|nr:DinB family protein [Fulvivirgaceae bacterium BMA10]